MIIVSQDKAEIINFDNINILRATKKGKILSYDNTYSSEYDCSDILGDYKTEERAKEVLQEITKTYFDENCEFENGMYHLQKIYEMPKE